MYICADHQAILPVCQDIDIHTYMYICADHQAILPVCQDIYEASFDVILAEGTCYIDIVGN
jgi:hypothetical protein